jgi:small GTP-binding protein
MKVVFVGESGVGKTCLIHRLVNDEFLEDFLSTLQPSHVTGAMELKVHETPLALWDTAGQEKYKALNRSFYREVAVACVCYCPDNAESRQQAPKLRGEVMQESDNAKMILVSTQHDRVQDKAGNTPIADFCAECGCDDFVETSAKTGVGLDDLREKLAKWASEGHIPPPFPEPDPVPVRVSPGQCKC